MVVVGIESQHLVVDRRGLVGPAYPVEPVGLVEQAALALAPNPAEAVVAATFAG
jgi:hypothetical protein